jgi:hypothetical protein
MIERLPRRLSGSAQMSFAAAPPLVEHYTQALHSIFAQHGASSTRRRSIICAASSKRN